MNSIILGWISKGGVRALKEGRSPTIHANQSGKFDIPLYAQMPTQGYPDRFYQKGFAEGKAKATTEFLNKLDTLRDGIVQ